MKNHFENLSDSYDLSGKRIAVVATDGFEQSELEVPFAVLEACGAQVDVVAPAAGRIRGWKDQEWGDTRDVTLTLDQASVDDYDALLLPGGVLNSDTLRTYPEAVNFVHEFFEQQKPVAAICHAGQILIEAGVVKGRTMTSYKSIRRDLENAGANWVDQSVVVDAGFVTSRQPDDLPDFCRKVCEEILEGKHAKQHA